MRFEELRIDLEDLVGVYLPSPDWVDVPGSPFQVRTRWTDPIGTYWVRVKHKADHPIGDHLILCENKDCPGCI
jgi:hypothetical protein